MRSLALAFAPILLLACSGRTGDYDRDFSADVERICMAMCEKTMECRDPPLFDTLEECTATCTIPGFMYDDNECGQALRDYRECIGNTQSCEEYLDTLEVDAEQFTCQQEGEAFVALKCGASDG